MEKDAAGNIQKVICEYFPETKSGEDNSNIKVKGTIGWTNATDAVDVTLRLYDRLFSVENPGLLEEDALKEHLNPNSIQVVTAKLEPSVKGFKPSDTFQIERQGYFVIDKASQDDDILVNRIVTLRDGWKK